MSSSSSWLVLSSSSSPWSKKLPHDVLHPNQRHWITTSTSTSASATAGPTNNRGISKDPSDDDDDDENSVVAAFDRQVKLLQRTGAARAHRRWWQGHKTKKTKEVTTSDTLISTKVTGNENANDDYDDIDNNNNDNDDEEEEQEDYYYYYDYFRQEIASRLVDRLDDIKRDEGFPLALDIGAGPGYIHRALCTDTFWDGTSAIGGVRKLVQLDSSREQLFRDEIDPPNPQSQQQQPPPPLPKSSATRQAILNRCSTYRLVANEEGTLPFPSGTFDLVMSSVALHWVNDLPKLFSEIKRVLKPDGCFLLAMMGGSTLPELRASLVLAEMEREGGVSPHVGPFCQLSDVGALMQAAGFALPTIDIDTIHLGYPHGMTVMEHLQRMGEANASLKRKPRTSRDTFLAAACLYDHLFGATSSSSSSSYGNQPLQQQQLQQHVQETMVEATVQVIYAIGWSPHASQQKPKARGSATHRVGSIVDDLAPPSPSSSSSSA